MCLILMKIMSQHSQICPSHALVSFLAIHPSISQREVYKPGSADVKARAVAVSMTNVGRILNLLLNRHHGFKDRLQCCL